MVSTADAIDSFEAFMLLRAGYSRNNGLSITAAIVSTIR